MLKEEKENRESANGRDSIAVKLESSSSSSSPYRFLFRAVVHGKLLVGTPKAKGYDCVK